jgi:beta-lactamase regulating signal transducer with metallopeptidase domain/Flp pilus assembly protein TadD
MTTIFELAARLQAAGAIETMLLVIAKATLILAIARVLLMVMPRASAATKHVVATAALVAVAAMPVATVVVPAWNIVVETPAVKAAPATATPTGANSAANTGASARTIGATDDETNERPSSLGTAITLAKATGVVPEEPLSAMARAMNVAGATWKGMIALALVTVTLLLFAQMLLGMLGVWHVAKNAEEFTHDAALVELDNARDALALDRDVRLLRSGRISVPVLWGFFKPVLLLPADVVTWPAERLRVVLLHELAHLKRFDGISLILTRLAVAIFWYHPLAWSLERAGRSECERACDDLVLAGGTKPSEYADHLLAIARSMPTFDPFRSVTLAMSRKSQLEGRLLSILQPQVARRVFSGRGVAVACALAVAVIIPVSALRLTAEQPQAEIVAAKSLERTNASVTVTPQLVENDVEAIGDYFLAKLGKYDKRADKFLRTPKNGEDWYERAYDLYRNDRFADAAEAFRQAAEHGYSPAKSLYNAACSFALLGDARHSVAALDEAINKGWDDFDHIADDSDFDPIRNDPAFVRLVSRDVAEHRVQKTMRRYEELNRTVKQGVHGGVRGGIEGGVQGGIPGGIKDAIEEGAEALLPDDIADAIEDALEHDDQDWFDVGLDLLRLRQFDQAINAFNHSIKRGEKVGTSMYNLACAYSLKGDVRSGMHWLAQSIENGFSSDDKLLHDPDIALLRRQPGFELLVKKAEDLEMKGCCDRDDDWNSRDHNVSWREAVEHHRAITQKYPDSGRAWFNLGFTALQARDIQTGIDAFNRAIALNYRVGTSSYNIACGHALAGNRDAAFQWLEKARVAGFDLADYLGDDEDLESLENDPRWDALVDKAGAKHKRKKRHS